MESTCHILVVDDEPGVASDTAKVLNHASSSGKLSQPVSATFETSFDSALKIIGRGGVDLLILDVVEQTSSALPKDLGLPESEAKGRSAFERIRSERFVPIIFLTALPEEVADLANSPFVQVISKREPEALIGCVEMSINSQFPRLYRALQAHVDEITRDFIVEFVQYNWADLEDRKKDIAYLLMRRLGISFDRGSKFLERIPGEGPSTGDVVPPIRYYIVPPPKEHRMGDILKAVAEDDTDGPDSVTRYVVVTPTCDLVKDRPKAEMVVLAECVPLSKFGEYRSWAAACNGSKNQRSNLERLLKSNPTKGQRDRYYYLPRAWTLPDMMVDFQRISYTRYADLGDFSIEASIDSPYAEELSYKLHSYLGRIGTPDLDLEAAIDQMRP